LSESYIASLSSWTINTTTLYNLGSTPTSESVFFEECRFSGFAPGTFGNEDTTNYYGVRWGVGYTNGGISYTNEKSMADLDVASALHWGLAVVRPNQIFTPPTNFLSMRLVVLLTRYGSPESNINTPTMSILYRLVV
jgi:hypothetical protein